MSDGEALKTHVTFQSDRFRSSTEQDEGMVWNDAVAEFLADGLRAKGFATDDPHGENWGFRIDVENDGFDIHVGCGSYSDPEEGIFLVFVEPSAPVIRKWFRQISTVEAVGKVLAALRDLLASEEGVSDVTWYTHDEWNKPSRS